MDNTILIKTAKTGYVIISSALCVLGVLFMIAPEASMSALGIICGMMMIAFGLIKITGYFSDDLYRLAFQHDLASGILMILLGILTAVRTESVTAFLGTVWGVFAMTDGLLKIQTSLDSRKFGIEKWWLILGEAILAVVAGLLLLFRTEESVRAMTVLLGISLFAEGLLNLGTVITAVKILKKERSEITEAERKDA